MGMPPPKPSTPHTLTHNHHTPPRAARARGFAQRAPRTKTAPAPATGKTGTPIWHLGWRKRYCPRWEKRLRLFAPQKTLRYWGEIGLFSWKSATFFELGETFGRM